MLSIFTYFASLLPLADSFRLSTFLSPTGNLLGKNGILNSHKLFFRNQVDLPYSPFQLNYYLSSNPDLSNIAGIKAWEHFILYGIYEGRSPHPFVANKYLTANMDFSEFGRSFHAFCYDPSQQLFQASPIVNVAGFTKQYDLIRNINPTFQLFANLPNNLQWINRRLNTISISSDESSDSINFAIANVLVNSITIGAPTPKIEIATKPISKEEIFSSTLLTISPGKFVVANDLYVEIGSEKVANSSTASSLFVGDKLVYSSTDGEVHADVLLIIRTYIDERSFTSIISSQENFVLSPRDEHSERAFKQYIADHSIKNVHVLNYSKTYKVISQRPPIYWDVQSEFIGKTLTSNIIPEIHHNLKGVKLVHYEDWGLSRTRHAEKDDQNVEVVIVDFSTPDFWLKQVSEFQFILTDEANFQNCLLSIPLFDEDLGAS